MMATESDWQSDAFRISQFRNLLQAFKEAASAVREESSFPIELEMKVFCGSNSKEDYLRLMARLILHFKQREKVTSNSGTVLVTNNSGSGEATSNSGPGEATSNSGPKVPTSNLAYVEATSYTSPGVSTSNSSPVLATSNSSPVEATSNSGPKVQAVRSGPPSPGVKCPDQIYLHQALFLILHANKCLQRENEYAAKGEVGQVTQCKLLFITNSKYILNHITTHKTDETCSVRSCSFVRKTLSHRKLCKMKTCRICYSLNIAGKRADEIVCMPTLVKPPAGGAQLTEATGGTKQRENQMIWKGEIKWKKKGPNPNDQKISHVMYTTVLSSVKENGEPLVQPENWPNKFTLKLVSNSDLKAIGLLPFKYSKSVTFNLQESASHHALSKEMSSGFLGFIHISNDSTIKRLLLIYNNEKKSLTGYIPNDQNGFVVKLNAFMKESRQAVYIKQWFQVQQLQQHQQHQQKINQLQGGMFSLEQNPTLLAMIYSVSNLEGMKVGLSVTGGLVTARLPFVAGCLNKVGVPCMLGNLEPITDEQNMLDGSADIAENLDLEAKPRNLYPYDYSWLMPLFDSRTMKELYLKVKDIAKIHRSFEDLPFTLLDLEHPLENGSNNEILTFLLDCYNLSKGDTSEAQAKDLIEFLKNNPPGESYENPKLPESCNEKEQKFAKYIFKMGIDLPGSKHNLFGNSYISPFFFDMFFGNYTEFIEHLNSLSKAEMKKALTRREGYCQFSPIFAPILGWKFRILCSDLYTDDEIKEIRMLYSGNNENRHHDILKKIIKNRPSSVNDFDITGSTPLHYALTDGTVAMVELLLKYGANPNKENNCFWRPSTCVLGKRFHSHNSQIEIIPMIGLLLQYKGKLIDKNDINQLRCNVESYTLIRKDLVVRIREAYPRDKNECERCAKPAQALCSACGLVYYCTKVCQKLDWKFHKFTCQDNKGDF